jgi:hypothetical protein
LASFLGFSLPANLGYPDQPVAFVQSDVFCGGNGTERSLPSAGPDRLVDDAQAAMNIIDVNDGA